MRFTAGLLFVVFASMGAGAGAGKLWLWGNSLSDARIAWFVAAAVVTNLICALLFYLVLRGGAAIARGGVWTAGFFCALNLVFTAGMAAWMADVIFGGVGEAGKGAHLFSWGMSYAFGQSFVDVRENRWFATEE